MNWTAGLQRAIDYIELNLETKLSFEDIAKQADCSSFYFQRLFSMLTGYSVGEYIRKRRLTKAASDLLGSSRVTDVAYKYGYDTPESFSRAFKTFHGCLPSLVKNASSLKSFSKIHTKLVIEGGKDMDYQIVTKGPFVILEKARYFSTENELNFKEIPQFWKESWKDSTSEVLCSHMKGTNFEGCLLGVCYNSVSNNKFKYSIAVEVEPGFKAPEGYERTTIPAQTWVVFKSVGSLPKSIQETTKNAYTQFFPNSEYQPNKLYDVEVYPDNSKAKPGQEVNYLWISVEKKA